MFQPAANHVIESAAARQRRQHSAVTIGTERQMMLRFQQHAAAGDIDCRHSTLAEHVQVLGRQAEPIVFIEIGYRLGMRGRAGHQVKRNPNAIAPSRGQKLLN